MTLDTHALFRFIGFVLAIYVAYSIYAGGIWTTTRMKRPIYRDRMETPGHFWTSVVVYGLLSIALMTVF